MFKHIRSKILEFFTFYVFLDFYTYKNKNIKSKIKNKNKTMHRERCMMHKCMKMKHLMHKEFYKDRKINDQMIESSTIGIHPHSNRKIVWNKRLMRSEMRVGRMKIGDAYRQGGKKIKNHLQQYIIFLQIWFSFQSTTSKKLKFLFFFLFS